MVAVLAYVLIVSGAVLVVAGLLAGPIAQRRHWLGRRARPDPAGVWSLWLRLYLWLLVVATWMVALYQVLSRLPS